MESKKLSDAELIETAEQWKPEGGVVESFAVAVDTMKELASRLKAANEKLAQLYDEKDDAPTW